MNNLGGCCDGMKKAIDGDFRSHFHIQEDNGVLYLSIGHLDIKQGQEYMPGRTAEKDMIGWFDQAVMYCPFCGVELQTKDSIKRGALN